MGWTGNGFLNSHPLDFWRSLSWFNRAENLLGVILAQELEIGAVFNLPQAFHRDEADLSHDLLAFRSINERHERRGLGGGFFRGVNVK